MLFFFSNVQGQQLADTLHELKVKGKKDRHQTDDLRIKNYASGMKVQTIDSTMMQVYQQQSVASLLAQQVPVFIKSYGFNGVATLNFRGSSAAQSQVLWNGIPLQNASLGLTDVSLLPVSLMDKINIVYGGSAALLGSGNVGGAVMLENDAPSFDSNRKFKLQLSGAAGSFGQYQAGAKASFSSKNWFTSLQAFGQTAQNNFTFTDQKRMDQSMPNAQLKGGGLLWQTAWRPNIYNTFSLSAWFQYYDRQIPPALFEDISVKEQKDESARFLLQWQHQKGASKWYAKLAYLQDGMKYRDSLSLLNTNNITRQIYGEAGWQHSLNAHHDVLFFVPMQTSWFTGDKAHTQTKLALAAAWRMHYINDRLQVAINARDEWVNSNNFFLPGANASYQLLSWLKLKANVQKTYRVPTLNELYYDPGGNKDLKPEQGWGEDCGYTIDLHFAKRFTLHQETSIFNRNINDWIIWYGGSIWTPHNIASVHSRGIETSNTLTIQLNKWQLHFGLNTEYVLATTTSSYVQNDGSIGMQIPYTPRYQWQANIGCAYKGFYLNYNHTYVGYRFLTNDESVYLDPYQTGNVQLMYSFPFRNANWRASLQCNNIWNQQYEVVAARPMPGVNWLAGLAVSLW
ncbi:hypothetical protein DN068_20555 [Taibaiella soli]|uniref:TonB-dependent receptor n=2 Tax=Taibaiella soli TaxID=1649169 RepID=A0A2W2ABU1_9BACT|nr:hypothetical protein DN068_20555 [Taibaiella soli]